MPNQESEKFDELQPQPTRRPLPSVPANSTSIVLTSSRLPFVISILALIGILLLLIADLAFDIRPIIYANQEDSALERLVISNFIYIVLSVVAISSGYLGARIIIAAGVTTAAVIPPRDYELLAPLITDGKSESIDQYVRLSSLTKFTGTFTQLGLTGLPLATIFLTLVFSTLTLIQSDDFLDLTKLTLGAFIGSFVQRQVERRSDAAGQSAKESLKEVSPPPFSA